MEEKDTNDLDRMLENAYPEDLEQYITAPIKLHEYFMKYLGSHNFQLNEIVKKSCIPSNYAYGILNGNRTNPSRDRVIALCLACHMDIIHTNRALKLAGLSPLYSKNGKDAAIIIMINREIYDLYTINEFLYEHNLPLLITSKI